MKKLIHIEYSRTAEKEISKLPLATAGKILKKIIENTSQADVLTRAKALSGRFSGSYRYRVGEYRVIFTINNKGEIIILTVISIKHRKDVYR